MVALLRRCRPGNGPEAGAAFAAAHARGEAGALELRYPPPPAFGTLRRELDTAAATLAGEGTIGVLYAARAAELELEAQLAERVGQSDFGALARRRHPVGTGPEWDTAEQLARRWCAAPVPPQGPTFRSDDARCPESLVSQLASEIGRRRVPVRVEVTRELSSRAACGDGVVFVRAGEQLSLDEARRITWHELCGHALPRLEARHHPLGLLRVGSARSSDDEEGRALHIEASHGLLDAARRRELGLRHLTALWVANGASVHDVVRASWQFGCDAASAVALYVRVARGGGLCRELEYLPAWLRFTDVAKDDPSLAVWLALGRVSVEAAGVLRAAGISPGRRLEHILDLSLSSAQATP